MLKQGVHPKIVQERLGHLSIQVTLDTYSHVAPGIQQAAANKFDDIVLQKRIHWSDARFRNVLFQTLLSQIITFYYYAKTVIYAQW
jgi:hypothetical protein